MMREYISNAFWVLVTWVVGVCSIIIGVGTFSHQSSTAFEFAILFIAVCPAADCFIDTDYQQL